MRVLFLNQYFPPDPAPTGVLFGEIADALKVAGHEVDFVDAQQDYRGMQAKGGRMRRELAALLRMQRAGKASRRPDVVVSGTSPPCLAVVADRVARKHGARHIHWAMDVYPEIAEALGEIRKGAPLAGFIRWLMGRAYRRCSAVVSLDEDMRTLFRGYRVESEIIRPWVFQSILSQPLDETPADAPWTWLYSGNLGRAHEWQTLLDAQQILESQGSDAHLRFQGGGPSWPLAQAKAEEMGLRQCAWSGYAPESELRSSLLCGNVLVATQREAAQGLLWPSKLALMSTLPRGILFVGPKDGAIARELSALPQAGVFAPGDAAGVAAWVAKQRFQPCTTPNLLNPAADREAAIAAFVRLIEAK